jgi:hypothetical protein
MIITADLSRVFMEIVVLLSISEYDRHTKTLVQMSAKSDPKDMGIWCGNVLYECEIWCLILKERNTGRRNVIRRR